MRLTHTGSVPLRTERLLLRQFQPGDAPAMFERWASSPRATRYLTWPPHDHLAVTEAVLAEWVSNYVQPTFYQWAIVPVGSDLPIGSISVVDRDETAGEVEIGYVIGPEWWGQGYTAEALVRLVDHFFAEVGVGSVLARCHPENLASSRVMLKAGMRRLPWDDEPGGQALAPKSEPEHQYRVTRQMWERR